MPVSIFGVCLFSLCLHGFSLCSPVSTHSTLKDLSHCPKNPKYSMVNSTFGCNVKGSTTCKLRGQTALQATWVELVLAPLGLQSERDPPRKHQNIPAALSITGALCYRAKCVVYHLPKQKCLNTFHHRSQIVRCPEPSRLAARAQ